MRYILEAIRRINYMANVRIAEYWIKLSDGRYILVYKDDGQEFTI